MVMRKRNRQVKIYMNEDEYKYLQDIVDKTNQSKQKIIINALKQNAIVTKEQMTIFIHLSEILNDNVFQLRKIGNNLNQLAKKANFRGYQKDETQILEMKKLIEQNLEGVQSIWQLIKNLTQEC